MNKLKTFITIISLIVFFSLGSLEAKTNEYGSSYNDTIPLKSISSILESTDVNGKIFSFQGEITAQCKNNACWFKVKDSASEVLVDLKPNGLKMPLGFVGRKVKLNGRVNKKDDKIQVDAISVIVHE